MDSPDLSRISVGPLSPAPRMQIPVHQLPRLRLRAVAQIRAPRYRADGACPQLSQLPAAPLEALRRAATDVLAPSRPCASARAAAARSKLPAASEAQSQNSSLPSRTRSPGCDSDRSVSLAGARIKRSRRAVALEQPPVAIVALHGCAAALLPRRLYLCEADMPQDTLTWDGCQYSRADFLHYGSNDAERFCKYQWATHMARLFLSTWRDFARTQDAHKELNALLILVRKQEYRSDPALGDMLLRYIFRALLLRWTYLGGPFANYTCSGDDRKALDGMAMVLRWCSDYLCEPNQKPRQAQRLFWQRYFGHKTLALVIATHGVQDSLQDWACTITKLEAATAYHNREDPSCGCALQDQESSRA
ncbi:unnamed protein product [Effrenium voratum]|uniref:Uncharacterized protein n=1 Tax=Effrenium voratum TaxID=2562239 RepID=A0AA36ID90_9DINO|nr:unnamed protein product [Effrenium voratum]